MIGHRKPAPVLITDVPEDPERELRRRQIRYLLMMGTRALCLIAAAVLVSVRPPLLALWLVLCVLGTVVLPWLAVILANDRPPKRRGARRPAVPEQRALPDRESGQIIDPG